jgi:hypothetical protein
MEDEKAERPYVYLFWVRLSSPHLRGTIERTTIAWRRGRVFCPIGEIDAKQRRLSVMEQYVLRFKVAVNHPLAVKVYESIESLMEHFERFPCRYVRACVLIC